MEKLKKFGKAIFNVYFCIGAVAIALLADNHNLYDRVKPALKRWLAVLNHIIVLVVDVIFVYQGFIYAGQMGKQISMGMEIPMLYMYGIMPVCGVICAICVVVKIITLVTADESYFAPKNVVLSADDA